jgi:outer membrane protein assembly factor BamB
VSLRRTTTSCRSFPFTVPRLAPYAAIFLALASSPSIAQVTIAEQDNRLHRSPSFFPVETSWTTDLEQPPGASPAYDETNAYIPLRDGTLVAMKLEDGTIAWKVTQPMRFAPAPSNGLVVVANESTLTAFHAANGQILWQADLGAHNSAPLLSTTGWLIASLETGEVVALRSQDGHELWRSKLSGLISVRPSISGDRLFVPIEEGQIAALTLATGKRLWERALPGSPQEILPLDALFVGTSDNYFYRLSVDTGNTDWRWRTGGDLIGVAAVDESRVYFLSRDNILRALDRRSGVQQWRQSLRARPTSGPTKAGNLLLVAGVAPQIRSFDLKTGKPGATYHASTELAAPPHVVTGLPIVGPLLVIVTGNGQVVALQRSLGPPQFSLRFPPSPILPIPELLPIADTLEFPAIEPHSAGPFLLPQGVRE